MNIQRLKFAWARGARIQFATRCNTWDIVDPTWMYDENFYRIHPDDEHLAYGPISSAMIEKSLYGISESPYEFAAMSVINIVEFVPAREARDYDEWSMFRLFAAEYLADEGL